ncbi:MAG: LPS assembly protein LptD [Gammaproteobacteria bacterium]|nr:LPS assembly protein LptD [Gammaproteobacteria bacterium]
MFHFIFSILILFLPLFSISLNADTSSITHNIVNIEDNVVDKTRLPENITATEFYSVNRLNCVHQLKSNNHTHQTLTKPLNKLTEIFAEEVTKDTENIVQFSGHVEIQQNGNRIQSNKASYDLSQELFSAHEAVTFNNQDMNISGDKLFYFTKTKNGEIKNAEYTAITDNFQGRAENITFSPDISHLTDASFSTCPRENESWALRGQEISLYPNKNIGEGKNIIFYIKDLPVFYLPYIQFPLGKERMSGVLFPTVYYSSDLGMNLSLPYYWNIAANKDYTITPSIMSKRGLFLNHEIRHLSSKSKTTVNINHIYDTDYDQIRSEKEISKYGSDIESQRQALSVVHHHLAEKWDLSLDYNYLSDNYFNRDFNQQTLNNNENNLNRSLTISHRDKLFGGSLSVLGRLQQYQVTTVNTNIYSRLPQFKVNYDKQWNQFLRTQIPLQLSIDSEFVNFKKNSNTSLNLPEGNRYHLRPSFMLNFLNDYSFIKPKVSLDLLKYHLTENNTNTEDYSRSIPLFSLDTGLFFERQSSFFEQQYLHTLEPRLYYLNVKDVNQSDFPVFDTDLTNFSFSQLFKENRFTGVDRLADANQLTSALTTRLINENGLESFRASIGQIWYFDDRNVHLNKSYSDLTDKHSATAIELASEFHSHWRTRLSLLYNYKAKGNSNNKQIGQANFNLQYYHDNNHIINLSYNDDSNETLDKTISYSNYWELVPNWLMLSSLKYKSEQKYVSNALLGFEYDSCCYAIRLALEHERDSLTGEIDNSIMFRIMFKGLSSFGNIDATHLSEQIPGAKSIY